MYTNIGLPFTLNSSLLPPFFSGEDFIDLSQSTAANEETLEKIGTIEGQLAIVKQQTTSLCMKVDDMTERLQDVTAEKYLASAVREEFRCKVCTNMPPNNQVVLSTCCGKVLGCANCIQNTNNEKCILCGQNGVAVIKLHGFEEVLSKIQKNEAE